MNNAPQTANWDEEALYQQYLRDISKYPLLTQPEEKALLRLVAEGNKEALDRLVLGNLRFVINIAFCYRGQGLAVNELINEGNLGLIEAARSFGATNFQIFRRVYVKEAFPGILSGIILTMISLVGYSAMGGAIGAGGLGDVAYRKGYQAYKIEYLVATSLVLIVFVQGIQGIGNKFHDRLC